jgi:catechol 2,3-dioxygenase-like lactoylglutathione lyase family enzyme
MNRHEAHIGYTGIHHNAFITSDMESTIRYWRDLLGFRLSLTMEAPGSGGRQYFFSLNDTTFVSFFEWPQSEKVKPRRPGSKPDGAALFDHLSLGVKSMEDLLDLQELLINAQLAVSDIVDHGFVLSVYSYDPNGISVEFSFVKPEKSPHRNPLFTDRSPCKAATEGPDPSGFYDRSVPDEHDPQHIVIRKSEESAYFD